MWINDSMRILYLYPAIYDGLIIALLLSGCANSYEYKQTDDGWNDAVVTTVTETERPAVT